MALQQRAALGGRMTVAAPSRLALVRLAPARRATVARANADAVRELEAFRAGAASAMGAAIDAAAAPAAPAAEAVKPAHPDIPIITKDTYDAFLASAGGKLAVLDFYTDFCGPCKMIYPELCALQAEMAGSVVFGKLNCNKANKELGVKLAIKVAPTFHLYKGGAKVAEMTGAKVDKLRALIAEHSA